MSDVPSATDGRAALCRILAAIRSLRRRLRRRFCGQRGARPHRVRHRRCFPTARRSGRRSCWPVISCIALCSRARGRKRRSASARSDSPSRNVRGERIGFAARRNTFRREAAVRALLLCVGYLLIAVTPRRQALHDLIAGTVVVDGARSPQPAWLVSAVACVPLVLVAAGMALPAYEDRTIRAQVLEGVDLANDYRAAIEGDWRNSPRGFVDITSDSLGAGLPQRGRYVEAIEVVSGMIVITYGAEANDAIAGSVLAIVPALDSQRALAWACGYGQPPAGYEVVYENPGSYTDIDEVYIPSACRSPR